MKVGNLINLPEQTEKQELAKAINEMMLRTVRDYLNKGRTIRNAKVMMGYNGDDFVRGNVTVIATWKSYRIPRIIKKNLFNGLTKKSGTAGAHRL